MAALTIAQANEQGTHQFHIDQLRSALNDLQMHADALRASGFKVRVWEWIGAESVEISHPELMPGTSVKYHAERK